jgi:hypothetical protein
MRLREYDRLGAARFDDPGFGHARWIRDNVRVTVLADASRHPDEPRAAVFGRSGRDAFCLVVADDGKVEYLLDRVTAAGDLDLDALRGDLAALARLALQRLAGQPADRLWNGLFRAAVWAAGTPVCITIAAGRRHVVIFDSEHTVGSPPAGPATRLAADRRLAATLARSLTDPAARPALPPEVTPAEFTAAAVVAAVVDGPAGTAAAEVVIDQVAVAGDWPAGGRGPVRASPLWWNSLDWYLLPAVRRRGFTRGHRL